MSEQTQKLREAFRIAVDHIDMGALEISHCKDAALILETLAMPTEPVVNQQLTGEQPVGALPKLPEPDLSFEDGKDQWGYTAYAHAYSADQMQAYGTECWKAGYKHGKRVQYLDSN